MEKAEKNTMTGKKEKLSEAVSSEADLSGGNVSGAGASGSGLSGAKRRAALLLLPLVPALACGLWLGDREFFWIWLAGGAYFFFAMAAELTAAVWPDAYGRLLRAADVPTGGVRFWLGGVVCYLLWLGFLFQLAMMIF